MKKKKKKKQKKVCEIIKEIMHYPLGIIIWYLNVHHKEEAQPIYELIFVLILN